MKISTFIHNSINKIFEKFPNLNECIYSYDKHSNTHFIKVPSLKLYKSIDFAKLDADISILFYNNNFEGSLCFISEDSVTTFDDYEIFENPYNAIDKEFDLFISNNFVITDKYYYKDVFDENVEILSTSVDYNYNCYSIESLAIAA